MSLIGIVFFVSLQERSIVFSFDCIQIDQLRSEYHV